jgi:hypothetical protein
MSPLFARQSGISTAVEGINMAGGGRRQIDAGGKKWNGTGNESSPCEGFHEEKGRALVQPRMYMMISMVCLRSP